MDESRHPERPAERIDDVLGELGRYWRAHPDLRLGQIIDNAASRLGTDAYGLGDAELKGALEFNILMIPADLPLGALEPERPDMPWDRRPCVLDVIRQHRARRSLEGRRP